VNLALAVMLCPRVYEDSLALMCFLSQHSVFLKGACFSDKRDSVSFTGARLIRSAVVGFVGSRCTGGSGSMSRSAMRYAGSHTIIAAADLEASKDDSHHPPR
jgi:hypothetical protein